MTKVLIINESGLSRTVTMSVVPNVGDSIAIFNTPFPRVKERVWVFDENLIDSLPTETDVEVILMVGRNE